MAKIPTIEYHIPAPPVEERSATKNIIEGGVTIVEQLARFNALNQQEKLATQDKIQKVSDDMKVTKLASEALNYNIANLNEFRLKNINNQNLANSYREAQIEHYNSILDSVKEPIRLRLAPKLNELVEKTYSNNLEWLQKQQQINIIDDVQKSIDTTESFAYTLGRGGTLNDVLNLTDDVIKTTKSTIPLSMEAERKIYADNVIAYLKGLPSPSTAKSILEQPKVREMLSAKQYIDISQSLNRAVEVNKKRIYNEAIATINDFEQAVIAGKRLPGTTISNIASVVSETGDGELAMKISNLYSYMDTLNSLNQASTEEITKAMNSSEDPYFKDLLARKITYQKTALQTNGLNYATSQGFNIARITNFEDSNQIQQRLVDIKNIESIYGESASVLYPEERATLKGAYDAALPEVKVAIGVKMAQGFKNYTNNALKEIGLDEADVQNVYYATRKELSNAQSVAEEIAAGREIIAKQKSIPKLSQLQMQIRESLKNLFDLNVTEENAAVNRITALYVKRAISTDSDSFDQIDTDVISKSITDALGATPFEYSPRTFWFFRSSEKRQVLPPIGTTENDFTDFFDNLTTSQLQRISKNQQLPQFKERTVNAKFIKDNALIVSIAPNIYRFLIKKGEESQYLMSGNEVYEVYISKDIMSRLK